MLKSEGPKARRRTGGGELRKRTRLSSGRTKISSEKEWANAEGRSGSEEGRALQAGTGPGQAARSLGVLATFPD